MTPSTCILLADYNRWMNTRLYDAAATLPEAELFADRGAFFGSLFNTLNHLAVADTLWLRRFASHADLGWMHEDLQPLAQPTSLTQRVADKLPQLRAYRQQADEVISAFARRVTPAHLASTLRYTTTAGQPQAKNFGALVLHLFNHQTHHRGQATTLLFQTGVDVGVTDLVALIPGEV